MAKPWQERPLWWKCYVAPYASVYLHAGTLIGHLGTTPFPFWDAAKLLPDYDKLRYDNAVRDLTVYTRREASPPRYELTEEARKVLRTVLGPPPGHPEYAAWWRGRLISVRQMREEGKEPKWAAEPPVPLEPEEPGPKPKKQSRKKKG